MAKGLNPQEEKLKKLIHQWFSKWREGDFYNLPIAKYFKHTSPFGTILGKEEYFKLVEANKQKFLGYTFEILDEIYEKDKACVRYTAVQGDFRLDVSEWYYIRNNLIEEIIAHYHIGEIKEDRRLTNQ